MFALITLVLTIGVAQADLTTDIISYWKFDENTGSTAGDSAGSNDGTITDATWTTGKINNGLDFGTNTDNYYVSVGDTSTFAWVHQTNEFSVSVWVYLNDDDLSTQILGNNYQGVGKGFYITKDTSNKMYFLVSHGGSSNIFLESGTLEKNKWYHVVATADGESSTARLYIDGTQVDTDTVGATTTGDSNSNLYLGRTNRNDRFHNGLLDEPAIWSRALTANEDLTVYNNESNNASFWTFGAEEEASFNVTTLSAIEVSYTSAKMRGEIENYDP